MAILEEESLQNEDKESWKHVSFGFKTMVLMGKHNYKEPQNYH